MGALPERSRSDWLGFRSDEERFERLSFFRIRDIERMTSFVTHHSEDAPRMLYLGADAASEAIELVKAAAYHAEKRGIALKLILLDLAGKEPESQITTVLEEIDRQQRVEAGPIRRLLDRIKFKPPGGVVSIDLPTVGQMVDGFAATPPVAGPGDAPVHSLAQGLQEIAGEGLTLMMVKESAALNDVVRNALYMVLRTAPGFLLIQGCERGYEVPKRLLSPDYEVFELCPLEKFELKGLFATRPMRTVFDYGASSVGNVGSFFQPQCYTGELFDWMYRQTRGHPVALSLLWLRLLRVGLVDQDAEGLWGSTRPLGVDAFTQVFAESSFALIDRKVAALPGHLRENGLALLRVAALSGPVAPVALILDHLGVTDTEERDDLIDAVDRHLGTLDGQGPDEAETGWGEENPAVFVNAGFSHDGLPKSLVYLFRSDLFRNAVVVHAEAHGRRLAKDFLEFLDARRPADTRTFALMCRHLARHAGSAERTAEQGRRLSWWVGVLERNDLSEQFRAALRAGRVDAETLWRYYNRAREAKSNQLALALLEAFYVPQDAQASSLWDPAIVPMGRLGYFYHEHAKQLWDAKEVRPAATEIARALEFTDPGTKDRADLLYLAIMICSFVDLESSTELVDEFLGIREEHDFEYGDFLVDMVVKIGISKQMSPGYLDQFPSLKKYLLSDGWKDRELDIMRTSIFPGHTAIADLIAEISQAKRFALLGEHAKAIAAFSGGLDTLPEPAALVFVLSGVSGHVAMCGCEEGDAVLKRGIEVLRSQNRGMASLIAPMELVVRAFEQGPHRERLVEYLGIALEIAEEGLRNDDDGRDRPWAEKKIAEWEAMRAG